MAAAALAAATGNHAGNEFSLTQRPFPKRLWQNDFCQRRFCFAYVFPVQIARAKAAHNLKQLDRNQMNFSQLGLLDALERKCQSLGYTEPTPIQKQAIPVVLKGSDLIGCAETGTGKTAAFLLPIIQRLTTVKKPGVRVLILAPTRELAQQTEQAYRQMAPSKGYPCISLIGGAGLRQQLQALRRGATVVVATPGRLGAYQNVWVGVGVRESVRSPNPKGRLGGILETPL